MSLLSRLHLPSRAPSFPQILLVSAALRIALILYSEWHDAHSVVKYTDIDYRVFSDAAHYILNPSFKDGNVAKGPWAQYVNFGESVDLGAPYVFKANFCYAARIQGKRIAIRLCWLSS